MTAKASGATVDLSVDVDVEALSQKSLLLAMRNDNAWASKYRNGESGSCVPYTANSSTECYSKAYSVSITAKAEAGLTKGEAGQAIATATVKFKIAIYQNLKDGTTPNPFAARTHGWTSLSATQDDAYETDSLNTFTDASTLLGNTWNGNKKVIGYVVIWIDGQADNDQSQHVDHYDGANPLNTSFTVTVAKAGQ